MLKKCLAMLLTMMLCVGLAAIDAFAASGEHEHPVCGSSCSHTGDHDDIQWTAWESTDSMPTEAGNYYLIANVNLGSGTWTVPSGTTKLCLNGKTVNVKTVKIENDKALTITDCTGNGKFVGTGSFYNSDALILNYGEVKLYSGSITGQYSISTGGGVHNYPSSKFYMYGGSITNNSGGTGGGIYNEGNVNMYGGSITGNSGGGVYNAGNFHVSGKVIINGNDGEYGNFRIPNNSYTIRVNGTLESDSIIGVSHYQDVGTITTGGADYIDCFFSDNPRYFVEKDGDNLKLSERQYTVTVTSSNDQHGTASANKSSGTKGSFVTLTAEPAAGYRLKEWEVISGGVTVGANNQFTIGTEDVVIQAVFEEAPSYDVTVTASPAEGGTVTAQVNGTSANKAVEGDTVTLTATANDGYRFKEWQVVSGGAAIDNNQFTMPGSNVEVTAVFERVYKVIIASDIQNGKLEADKSVAAAGEEVTLIATPDMGYRKGQYTTTVSGTGSISLSGDVLIMPPCDVKVSVEFIDNSTYTMMLQMSDAFSVKKTEDTPYPIPYGGSYSFTVYIAPGYEKTDNFTVRAGDVGGTTTVLEPDANGVYTIRNITAKQSITVSGVFPCKPDSNDDFVGNAPFMVVCKNVETHTQTAPYYHSDYITDVGAVYASGSDRYCKITFDVAKYMQQEFADHRATDDIPATVPFTLQWKTGTRKWYYVNEPVTYAITCAPTLTKIEVTTQPKLDYSEGDALDLSAMKVTATWSDNSTTELGYADVEVSVANGTPLAKAAHNGTVITVTYNGQTAQTNALSVKSGNTGVSAVTVKGAAGTINGNVVSVVLPYGNKLADLTDVDFDVTLADSAAKITTLPTSNDGGATWLFTVTAENDTPQVYTVNVSIGEDPDAGDKTDVSNIKLAIGNHNWTVAQETANTSEAVKVWIESTLANSNLNGVTASEVTITAITPAVAGDMYNLTGTDGSFTFTVKLSKGNVTDTVEITTGVIMATAHSGNAFVPVTDITGVPTSTTAGTPLTLTGVVEPGNATYMTITWSVKAAGNTSASISGNTLTATAAGDVVVTATIANGKSATEAFTKDFVITVNPAPVVLTGIAVTTAPTKTVYTEGESFDPAGMVVTATYSDGTTEAVTGYTIAPNGALTTTNTDVTITYTENGVTKTATQSITVNAKPAATYTVTFDSNGGSGTMAPQAFTEDVAQNLTLNAFTREGFTFIGWNTAADASGISFADGASITASGNATLYAQWQKNAATVYTVTVSNDGNGTGTAIPSSGASGTEVTLTATPNSGYRFKEWQVITGGVTVTDNKLIIGTANVEVKAIFTKDDVPTHTADITITGLAGKNYASVHAKLMPFGEDRAIHDKQLELVPGSNPETYLYHETAEDNLYNLVVTATEVSSGREVILTTLIDLCGHDDTHAAYLPDAAKSSIMDDNTGLGIITGNIELIAAAQQVDEAGGHLEVTLNVTSGYDQQTGTQDKQMIVEMAAEDDKTVKMALDIDLMLYQYDKNDKLVDEKSLGNSNKQLLEIMIPFNMTGLDPDGIAVYRVHEGEPHQLPYAGEYFEVDAENNAIILHVMRCSSYAIAYGEPKAIPQITDPAGDTTVTVIEGEKATLTIAAQNAAKYQWYIDFNDGAGWKPCGDGTATYVSAPTKLSNNGYRYYCKVTSATGETAKSPIFTLVVVAPVALPETGDHTQLGLWAAMLVLCSAGMIALRSRKRRTE